MSGSSISEPHIGAPGQGRLDQRFSVFIYQWRWWLTVLALVTVMVVAFAGISRLTAFQRAVFGLGDTSIGTGTPPAAVFDPSLHIWFAGLDNKTLEAYYDIEKSFIAEDFIVVSYEADDDPYGVFGRESLSTIARLTEQFLTIPGVRHVRSLTQNPWIRWGAIQDNMGTEEGLIVSDLVEVDPATLTDDQIVERMIAVLGAKRAAARVGEERVRTILGVDADFSNHIGEPLLLGTIVNSTGTTTAIQVQVIRPRQDPDALSISLGDDPGVQAAATGIHSAHFQRAVYRGIEHFLRLERGLAIATPEYKRLSQWVQNVPDLAQRDRLRLALKDPTKNLIQDESGQLVRKYFEYDPMPDGRFVDSSHSAAIIQAPKSFKPEPRVPYSFHTGGEPLWEKSFEDVGMADSKFIPLMFLIIAFCLAIALRSVVGVIAPILVTLAATVATICFTFSLGELLNNMTAMTPNVITAVSIADTIHLVASWAALRGHYDDKRALIIEVVRKNALPLFLTSLTTAIGFITLIVSSILPVDLFGGMCAFGAISAYLITITVVPALLSLVPHHRTSPKGRHTFLLRLFSPERAGVLSEFIVRRRRSIVLTTAGLTVMSVVGLGLVNIDSNLREFFPADNPVMMDYEWIEDRLGGVGDLEIVFEGKTSSGNAPPVPTPEQEDQLDGFRVRSLAVRQGLDGIVPLSAKEQEEMRLLEALERTWNAARIGLSPEFLGQLDRFEMRVREEMNNPSSPLRVVTDLVSPLDVLRKINQVQNENQAVFYRVPRNEDVPNDMREPSVYLDPFTEELLYRPGQNGTTLTAQYFLQYENGARPGEALTTQLNSTRTKLRMQGRMKIASANIQLAAARRIEEIAANEFPMLTMLRSSEETERDKLKLSSMVISGRQLLQATTVTMVGKEFIASMLLALTTITVLIGGVFRSARLALVSMLPNVLPIVAPLSVFGFLGLPLTAPTAFVSAIALGVCVDDSIHFISQYIASAKYVKTPKERIAYVLHHVGPAMTVTTIVLVIGFGTMLFSEFTPNVLLGALVTTMVAIAWLTDLIVTPAVLSYIHVSTANEAADAPMEEPRTPAHEELGT